MARLKKLMFVEKVIQPLASRQVVVPQTTTKSERCAALRTLSGDS